jgi:hypothetical protein
VKSGIGMEQIVVRELTRELIETVRKEARQMRRTLKPLMRRVMSLADAAAYLPENASRKCGVFEAVALYYGAEVFLALSTDVGEDQFHSLQRRRGRHAEDDQRDKKTR